MNYNVDSNIDRVTFLNEYILCKLAIENIVNALNAEYRNILDMYYEELYMFFISNENSIAYDIWHEYFYCWMNRYYLKPKYRNFNDISTYFIVGDSNFELF